MQITASNLIIAAQQAHQAKPPRPAVAPTAGETPGFEPLSFAKPEAKEPPRPPATPGPIQRPGSQLDIKI